MGSLRARVRRDLPEGTPLKSTAYEECYAAIVAIWRDEGGATLDEIALMATINSVLANRFDYYFWTGFYRVCGDRLAVGPYIGTVGCLQIEFGRGVCGTAAQKRETILVPDVNQFPGHIACDPNSKVGDRRAGVRSREESDRRARRRFGPVECVR